MNCNLPLIVENFWDKLPEWLSAAGTIGAVITALWIASKDQRRRRDSEKFARATGVTAWLVGESNRDLEGALAVFNIRNIGSEPVYEFIATIVRVSQGNVDVENGRKGDYEFRSKILLVPPGQHELTIPWPGRGANSHFGLEISFRDAGGQSWVRRANGKLIEIHCSPLKHYEIEIPTDWNDIETSGPIY